jgi:hypothetical protein
VNLQSLRPRRAFIAKYVSITANTFRYKVFISDQISVIYIFDLRWLFPSPTMGSFELFGMDTATSVVLVIAFFWGLAMLIGLVAIISCCCIRRCRQARLEQTMPPPRTTDKLIPPIFFTEQLLDPLAQEDLREHAQVT